MGLHERLQSLDYLDIVISINGTKLRTTLFEKELNLYQYIPPHSAHPPSVLTGLVLGNCHRIYTLCSDPEDVTSLLRMFYYRLQARGYTENKLVPLFDRTHSIAQEPTVHPLLMNISTEEEDKELLRSRIFFHIGYHPTNPPSSTLQQTWNSIIIRPPLGQHIANLENSHGKAIGLKKMTIAYSRPPNLGNLLSSRNLHLTTGSPVSSYRITHQEGTQRECERERERESF